MLADLTLKDKSLIHGEKKKVGPWSNDYKFSKYTENGTALLDYKKLSLERNVIETYIYSCILIIIIIKIIKMIIIL